MFCKKTQVAKDNYLCFVKKNFSPLRLKMRLGIRKCQSCIFVTHHENNFLEQIFFEATTAGLNHRPGNQNLGKFPFCSNKLWLDHYFKMLEFRKIMLTFPRKQTFSWLDLVQKKIMRSSIYVIERGYFKLFCFLSFEQKVRLIFRPVNCFLKEPPSLVFQTIHISK